MEPIFVCLKPPAISPRQLDGYLALGWFRMGQRIFTTSHVELGALHPVRWLRYPVANLPDRASLRRLRRRNAGFRCSIDDLDVPTDGHAELYARYREHIDFDAAWTIEQALFDDTDPAGSLYRTKVLSVFDGDQLIAGGYFDVGEDSAASILHFYHPDWAGCSPGKHLILLTVDHLRAHGYRYYYPGYVVEGHPKMNYKLFLGARHAEHLDFEDMNWKPLASAGP